MRRLAIYIAMCIAMHASLGAVLVVTGCVGSGEDTAMPAAGDPPAQAEEDRERVEALAGEYRAHPTFARQWALARIGADRGLRAPCH